MKIRGNVQSTGHNMVTQPIQTIPEASSRIQTTPLSRESIEQPKNQVGVFRSPLDFDIDNLRNMDSNYDASIDHNWEIEISEHSYSVFNLPSIKENAEVVHISINRYDSCQDMLELYKDPSILDKRIVVELLGESGADAGGLTKELFNLFWKNIESTHFDGEDCLIPFLPLHRLRKETETFPILGRILSHMLLLTNTVPSKISRIVCSSLAGITIGKNVLLEEFLLFVPPVERVIIKRALSDYKTLTDFEKETLTNIFSSYQYFDNPNETDCREQIHTIANEILVERPKLLISKFKSGIPEYLLHEFWENCTADSLTYLLASYHPTIKKILESINSDENLTNEQSRVLHYLHMFISSLNKEDLLEFLFFVTGSYSMNPDMKITLTFNTLRGNLRRPISHTCNNVLELSSTYCSYQDFKKEMTMYLKCSYSYEYTQA